ncbi:MAG TPA: transcription antitermination factor NusB [Fibrobacteria bacterium]|jgi:16S rRNA (cytosine967-C5)-methyltransferase|nr:transcription antitermination factor NusB [Fibrobacteria bacterium]
MSVLAPGVETRLIAWQLLLEQEAEGAFLKDLFPSRLAGMRDDDAALARTICLGVIRRKRLLDHNLEQHARRGIRDPRLRMLLRVGAQQMLFLTGIPAFAAVNTAVEIAKSEFGKPEAGFVNAVLKSVARDGLLEPTGNDFASLAVRHSHPEALVRRWGRALKPVALEAALRRNNEEAPLWIRVNPRRADADMLVAALGEEGIRLEPHPDAPLFFRVAEGAGEALRSRAFAEGRFSVQDPVAHWVISLLDWSPGLSLLDACSAPGGKAALALELAAHDAREGADISSARIVCGDASFRRLRRIADARVRLGHLELEPVTMDLARPPFGAAVRFDRILLDAPCSNLGVLRRRPEARWSWTTEKIASLASRQAELLESASALLKRGGRLVYATCSAEAEETVDVVSGFLAKHPEFRAVDAGSLVPGELCREGFLRVWPGETEYDGFFAAALELRG